MQQASEKPIISKFTSDTHNSTNQFDILNKATNFFQEGGDQINELIQGEASVKKTIKNMCHKPERIRIDFYKEGDISIYSMIKQLASTAVNNCNSETCDRPRVAHTDYYYHGSGTVEIKYMDTPSGDQNVN